MGTAAEDDCNRSDGDQRGLGGSGDTLRQVAAREPSGRGRRGSKQHLHGRQGSRLPPRLLITRPLPTRQPVQGAWILPGIQLASAPLSSLSSPPRNAAGFGPPRARRTRPCSRSRRRCRRSTTSASPPGRSPTG
jgi:hypothetical protein